MTDRETTSTSTSSRLSPRKSPRKQSAKLIQKIPKLEETSFENDIQLDYTEEFNDEMTYVKEEFIEKEADYVTEVSIIDNNVPHTLLKSNYDMLQSPDSKDNDVLLCDDGVVELQSPDGVEHLELRSLNGDAEPGELMSINDLDGQQRAHSDVVSLSEEPVDDLGGEEPPLHQNSHHHRDSSGKKKRRPCTPLSPFPETMLQHGDDMNIDGGSGSENMEDIESSDSNDEAGRKDNGKYGKDRSSRDIGKRLSGDVPRAYRVLRRRPLTVDERMAKNRRRRLQRLRSAMHKQREPVTLARPLRPTADISRRNPSYYPRNRSRSPIGRFARLPVVSCRRTPPPRRSRDHYSPFSHRLSYDAVKDPHRLPASLPHRRSRSPRSHLPFRPSSRRRSPPPLPPISSSLRRQRDVEYDHRERIREEYRLPSLLPLRDSVSSRSSYERATSIRPSIRHRLSATVSDRYRASLTSRRNSSRDHDRPIVGTDRPRLPLPPVKRWRCAKREPTPV